MDDTEEQKYYEALVDGALKATLVHLNNPQANAWVDLDDIVCLINRHSSEKGDCSLQEKRKKIRKIFESILPCIGEHGISNDTCDNCNKRFNCYTIVQRVQRLSEIRQHILDSIDEVTKVEHD